MTSIRGERVALAVCFVAFLIPIPLSLRLAWDQSMASEKAVGIRYASEVVRRGEESSGQFLRAIELLNEDHVPPCSPQELDLMRQIDVGSSYIQMVGRMSGGKLVCTSQGITKPIAVGPPTLVTENGVSEWMDIRPGSLRLDKLDMLEYKGVAILADTGLLTDQETEKDANLALVVPSTGGRLRLVDPPAGFRANWLNPIGPGQSVSFLDSGYVVSQVRSKTRDIEAVSVLPVSNGYGHVKQFAMAFVPIGLLCGLALAWAVRRILLTKSSLPGLIRSAIRDQNFFVVYQPIVELSTRRIVGAEALVRWRRGQTVIGPDSFIQLAEDSGVISLITKTVMNIVSHDLPRLLRVDPDFHVAVNLSATDLKDVATRDRVMELLHRSGASPRNLVLEATEHGLVGGADSLEVIKGLREEGICVAIDDFGTGYSSLSCLQSLGLDSLKIDKAFVDTIGTDGATSGVVAHIIEMARTLRLRTVAEGVQTEAQVEFLLRRNVDYAQGWLFGRPMSIDSLCDRLCGVAAAEHEETAELLQIQAGVAQPVATWR
jgi:sensor c-di-GMP phosphodiesterase-like protein